MSGHCKKCARALKPKTIIGRGGFPETALVCKSPICKLYGKPQ